MKKRQFQKKLSLRKDTLRTLGQDTLGQVAGGTSGHPVCDEHTENHVCIATTLARTCVHHNTVGCQDTYGCSASCHTCDGHCDTNNCTQFLCG